MQENQNYDSEIDLRELFSVLWRGKYFVIIFTMMSLAAGSLHLRSLSSKYSVSILLAPIQAGQTTPNFGNLGGLASLAGLSLPTGSASDFAKYEIMLKTQEISTLVFKEKNLIQALFSNEWDNRQQIFRAPEKSRKTLIKSYARELLTGQPPKEYTGPNPARLKAFIGDNISISLDKKTQYLNLSAQTSNPKLLTKLLVSMINNTDELFKKKFIRQANDAVQFYQIKIAKARSQEHREILATLIAKEERKLLLATRGGPFVAEILTGPNRSLNPTSPKASLILALSILLGGFLSCGLLLIRSFLSKNHNE
ncbi:Wzz/FepE/Etk N-terminal domain-containing protein [Paracoccaceae bacterium]|nr:Wzz/FepE/Etk N-terminal domain-containing protein [Paracoccaceae bacterium]